ncbi:MAG: SDR family oxidoreductase [Bacteroidota bacterium]
MRQFTRKVAVITGAGNGIGRCLAQALATEGAHLALADIGSEALEETVKSLPPADHLVTTHVVDVANREAVEEFTREVVAQHGAAHLIINNAGVSYAGRVTNLLYEDMEWIMNINYWGVVYGTKSFLPVLLEQGEGHIVNISSIFGLVGVPTQAAYNATKFAVRGFTEALRRELAESPIGVTCVHPGGIRTQIAERGKFAASPQSRARWIKGFDKMAKTTPEAAAANIVNGVRRNKVRVLIGRDAYMIDFFARLFPSSYERFV